MTHEHESPFFGTPCTFMISLSYACAINYGKEVVLTGGFGNRKDVSVYSMSGFVGNLPDLHEGRQYHACASYNNIYDEKVTEKNQRISLHRYFRSI